ncbi:MAG TPA: arylesterase [Edaphobacter sp.]|uniref:arylesterase n=1 Tax=Edaphobacter sp. TaxID=1934404 RepID=UPI002C8CEC23|nr:arylesterase [Edaphobacter sp.]HUZ94741.1 arylesterase [Edaphobacter sp.]
MRQIEVLFILAALTIGMGGCKSSRTAAPSEPTTASTPAAQPQPPAPPAATAPDHRPLVVCFGDSLTAGYGADPGDSYPDYLQADLDARGYHYRVVNEGISGNTTKDAVARLDHILALKPAVVVVELGGNDGLRGLPIADSRANLDKIVATIKASGAKVALAGITLPPDYGPDYIKQFDATYTLLAKKYHVTMLPFLLKGVYGVPGMMQADQTHATAAGNKIVAGNILPLVLPLLKK